MGRHGPDIYTDPEMFHRARDAVFASCIATNPAPAARTAARTAIQLRREPSPALGEEEQNLLLKWLAAINEAPAGDPGPSPSMPRTNRSMAPGVNYIQDVGQLRPTTGRDRGQGTLSMSGTSSHSSASVGTRSLLLYRQRTGTQRWRTARNCAAAAQ